MFPADEWELPGGKPGVGETLEACLARELLNLRVEIGPIPDARVCRIEGSGGVLLAPYGSGMEELTNTPILDGYKKSIRAWSNQAVSVHA